MPDRHPNIITSRLSRTVAADGVTVVVNIHRLEDDAQWVLEVVNEVGTSTVWDDPFFTDEEAYAAFQQTVEDEGMETFLDRGKVIPFPRRH